MIFFWYVVIIWVLALIMGLIDQNATEASVPFGFLFLTSIVYFTPVLAYYAYLGFIKG